MIIYFNRATAYRATQMILSVLMECLSCIWCSTVSKGYIGEIIKLIMKFEVQKAVTPGYNKMIKCYKIFRKIKSLSTVIK